MAYKPVLSSDVDKGFVSLVNERCQLQTICPRIIPAGGDGGEKLGKFLGGAAQIISAPLRADCINPE